MSNFDEAVYLVLKHEGGYVNNPNDTGGETNFGISKRAYPNLNIAELSVETAQEIYKRDFWDKVKGDKLPEGLDLMVFDFAVNAGVSRASKVLQKMLGAKQDGIIGSKTLNLLRTQDGTLALITEYYRLRQAHYEAIDSFQYFGHGWTRRNNETLKESLSWIC